MWHFLIEAATLNGIGVSSASQLDGCYTVVELYLFYVPLWAPVVYGGDVGIVGLWTLARWKAARWSIEF